MSVMGYIEEIETWKMPILKVDHEPILIRLSICARWGESVEKSASYLLVIGFFKILNELDIISYRYDFDHRGLVFYIEVRESRSATKAYLDRLKNYHMLGRAWKFEIIDGRRVSLISSLSEDNRPIEASLLESMARVHMSMGSRPLRFSKYFLYAALIPYTRIRGYGCCIYNREDAKGRYDFYVVLQALEIMHRSLASLDFSDISSFEELNKRGNLIENAISEYSGKKGLLKGLLYKCLILATLYEKKISYDNVSGAITKLNKTQDKEIGFIQNKILSFYRTRDNIDDLSLYILSLMEDSSLIEDIGSDIYKDIQKLASRAIFPGDVDRDSLNELFYSKGLSTRDVQNLISITIILDLLDKEENIP